MGETSLWFVYIIYTYMSAYIISFLVKSKIQMNDNIRHTSIHTHIHTNTYTLNHLHIYVTCMYIIYTIGIIFMNSTTCEFSGCIGL